MNTFTIPELAGLEKVRCIPCGGEGGFWRGQIVHVCEQCGGKGWIYREGP